jgi:branched-chain amino acid transport system ATP-binding protein
MCSRIRSGFQLATCSPATTLALADRAYIINNGHIVYEGAAQEIKARPEILHRHLGV